MDACVSRRSSWYAGSNFSSSGSSSGTTARRALTTCCCKLISATAPAADAADAADAATAATSARAAALNDAATNSTFAHAVAPVATTVCAGSHTLLTSAVPFTSSPARIGGPFRTSTMKSIATVRRVQVRVTAAPCSSPTSTHSGASAPSVLLTIGRSPSVAVSAAWTASELSVGMVRVAFVIASSSTGRPTPTAASASTIEVWLE
mmetsp:Transcript_33510/g.88236  ORF Transcript_33510/g.88236 Transcript_33510/m.88236 type:complete len:206 (-) Transcript_33510:725-1342(-)